jgi:hypothetical protein
MAKTHCLDCQSKITANKYFMVKNDLWEKYGVGEKFLCVICFENRIGRKLNASDLMPHVYVNEKVNPYTMDLLKE